MKIFAETERLILREMLLTDAEGMYELDSDAEVHRYVGNQPVENKEQIEAVIHFVRQQYKDNGIGRWAVVEKQTNNFIGWAGLKFVKEMTNKHINYYDLGYRLIRKYWGQGFASESAAASLTYGFETLQLNEIFATVHPENTASNGILKKMGFQFIETFADQGEINYWYKLDRKTWENNIYAQTDNDNVSNRKKTER